MGKIRRGNYIFLSYKGDHSPRHVHIFRDERLAVKWDLENDCEMKGIANARLRALIQQLKREGIL